MVCIGGWLLRFGIDWPGLHPFGRHITGPTGKLSVLDRDVCRGKATAENLHPNRDRHPVNPAVGDHAFLRRVVAGIGVSDKLIEGALIDGYGQAQERRITRHEKMLCRLGRAVVAGCEEANSENQKAIFHGARTANDPKLSDSPARRGPCMVGGKAEAGSTGRDAQASSLQRMVRRSSDSEGGIK